jgi:hypothetical protein
MEGRDFVAVAREAARGPTEAHWRTAASRAYYGLLLEIRDAMTAWGLSRPAPSQVHQLVRRRLFTSTDPDMKRVGIWLDDLRESRSRADYETDAPYEFVSASGGWRAVRWADDALKLFDAINADTQRRATIAAEIRAVLP